MWKPKPRKQKTNCAWCFENEVNKKRMKLKSVLMSSSKRCRLSFTLYKISVPLQFDRQRQLFGSGQLKLTSNGKKEASFLDHLN